MPASPAHLVYAPYTEHVPPDVTACIFWLKNRDPQHWRHSQRPPDVSTRTSTRRHEERSLADALARLATPNGDFRTE
jgi:hypothetical protein